MTVTGGCRCGKTRYSLDVEAMPLTYACHCTLCQRSTGASFAHQMPVREAVLSVEGSPLEVAMTGPSGSRSIQRYCPECLTRLYNTNEARPGLVIVRAGTIDGSERLSPVVHIFTSTKQPWITLPEDAEAYADAAPMEAWGRFFR
ncbi:GFA family protein [Sphingomonas sp.]|uniref:GFA family protein n=1 Tax=Sphingomonas sp. TaxID=28214 RepID=UPI001B20E2D0|nr:GFA family protein [Sphingomonas sp.]MBO9712898.1 GFA family protein [Sphingomonas sp.]